MNLHRRLLRRAARKARKVVDRVTGTDTLVRIGNTPRIEALNEWQSAFCEWWAERNALPLDEVKRRFLESTNAVRGGHGGAHYRRFCILSYALYLPFAADTRAEVLDAYEFHTHMHFLRMLSYSVPKWEADRPIFVRIAGKRELVITDFGCGLAQKSISFARAAQVQGHAVRMQFADVSRLQLDFLSWFCTRCGIPAVTFRSTEEQPIPEFPHADVLFAEEVLEHVHDPVFYVEQLDKLIVPGGVFVGNLHQHQKEFMHVSPNLEVVRARLRELSYEELERNHVYGKPAGADSKALTSVG